MADSGTPGLRLTLMRHADADLPPVGTTDLARPLTENGLLQARTMGKRMAQDRQPPHQVLCSDAERTLQTARSLLAAAQVRAPLLVLPDLYDSTEETILKTLGAHADPMAGHVLLIAHNPGIAHAVSYLAGAAIDGFLPATSASFTVLNGQWRKLRPASVKLERVLHPETWA